MVVDPPVYTQNAANNTGLQNCYRQPCGCYGECYGWCRSWTTGQLIAAPASPKLQTADSLDAFAADAKCPEKMRKKLSDAAAALRESHAQDLLDQAKRYLKSG